MTALKELHRRDCTQGTAHKGWHRERLHSRAQQGVHNRAAQKGTRVRDCTKEHRGAAQKRLQENTQETTHERLHSNKNLHNRYSNSTQGTAQQGGLHSRYSNRTRETAQQPKTAQPGTATAHKGLHHRDWRLTCKLCQGWTCYTGCPSPGQHTP